ncbi:hypothetical protein SELMODRAFT_419491 [Selaginella moellendorffii]|uniref:Uncharacterized protein n=1 Tax=Selaginella moellendorffii TaxID=88036 RepID=D8S943_SELML|nr:hypothetical protein SELMODRAFT_419491 [Selaginella moellendorffii]
MASQGTSSPKIHVLGFPVPGQGHITPMMHVCKKIAARDGFIVSFVNVESLHDEIIKHWRAPSNTDLRLVSIPLSWKIPHGLDAYTLTHSGVPLLCWPWGVEQNTNAKLVIHDWKIGAGFARGANGLIGRGDIEKTLREVMDGERGKQMKDTVEVLKCKARKAVESGGRSAASLDGFLKGLSSQ